MDSDSTSWMSCSACWNNPEAPRSAILPLTFDDDARLMLMNSDVAVQ